jgi:secreted trypsin-like serine protease
LTVARRTPAPAGKQWKARFVKQRFLRTLLGGAVAIGLALTLGLSGGPVHAAGSTSGQPAPSPSATGGVHTDIIGGTGATESYDAMVSLQVAAHGDPDWHRCGGNLVFHTFVEINAHCVTQDDGTAFPASMFHVRIGSPDRRADGILAYVTQIYVHAGWDWATGEENGHGEVDDIALLKLDRYVQEQPIQIPTQVNKNGIARLIGWGITEPDGSGEAPQYLQELDSRLLPVGKCTGGFITRGELCVANVNGTDGVCNGDSGGPAMQRVTGKQWQVVGSASRTTTDDCGTGPAVYTDVSFFRSWVYDVARTGQVPPAAVTTQSKTLVQKHAQRWDGRLSQVLAAA